MPDTKSFNLFRVNCLLNDSKSTNFNSIILSIVAEFFYEIKNETRELTDLYRYINQYLKIDIEYEYLQNILIQSEFYKIEPTNNVPLISVLPEKFHLVEVTIETNSLDKYIHEFLVNTGNDFSYKEKIERLLYSAVFENINSFSVESLKSLLPNFDEKEFSKEEIDVFNAFLEYKDNSKDRTIFNVLSRAVEFAILTSGRGIKEFNVDLFGNKTFVLDTNIIFRLMGIGGSERAESVMVLLTKCKKMGISFVYSGKTHLELHNKLDQIVSFLNSEKVQSSVQILGDLSTSHPELFNDDFIVHYSIVRGKGDVSTPQQYQRKLNQIYQNILKELDAKVISTESLDEREINYLAKQLFIKKKEMGVAYGKKASEVDASNILIVRKTRGLNNYNFSDVKSFYLTSDRSLNKIVSLQNPDLLPETILPSQVYILCNPYFDDSQENDYAEFIKFIKRRKTGFKYAGSQVLTYINSVREITTNVEVISESLILYSDIRYRAMGKDSYRSDSIIPTYKDILKTFVDKELDKGANASKTIENLRASVAEYAYKKIKLSILIARVLDWIVTIAIVPLVLLFGKSLLEKNWAILIVIVIACEGLKFYLSSRFDYFKSFSVWLYRGFTKSIRKQYLNVDAELVDKIDSYEHTIPKNVWGK